MKLTLFRITSVFVSIALIIISAIHSFNGDLHVVYPVNDVSIYEIDTYHEELDSNWSEAAFSFDRQKRINFKYKLTTAREEPFAAFYFRDADIESKILDISNYNKISIFFQSKKAQRIPITLRFHNKTINLNKKFPEISITKVIDYKGPGVYEIPLNEFEIAAWWLRYHGIEKEQIDLSKVTELKYLAIGSCQALQPGEEDEIIIDQVIFKHSDNLFYWVLISLIFLNGGINIYLYQRKRKKKNNQPLVVRPIEIEHKETANEKLKNFKIYIGRNYQNSELTMYIVQKELKLSANELRNLLKDELDTTFKNYLKKIRLTEVKRLLKESDLTISEIAYKCGFNDIPYFNRVFKAETGKNPKDYKSDLNN